MTTPQDEMRAKFEAWYIDHAMNEVAMVFTPDEMVRLRDGDQYGDHYEYLNARWSEWQLLSDFQAATAAQAEALAAAQADAASALGLLSRVRFALGDNGTRMQDELIEWCKGLNPGALAAVKAELTMAQERATWLVAQIRDTQEACGVLQTACMAAQADTARLDTLQQRFGALDQWIVAVNKDSFTVNLGRKGHATRKTLREAIDAARATLTPTAPGAQEQA